ncbi:hypothetical protein NFI96_026540 [Prochilodus magdalenae]|nr:hypothetical protein NFI96_026540 [Prochilodus magdalenae]
MSGKGNPRTHLNGFPVPHFSYFFPHVLGGLSPPAVPALPLSGYSTPSPAKSESESESESQTHTRYTEYQNIRLFIVLRDYGTIWREFGPTRVRCGSGTFGGTTSSRAGFKYSVDLQPAS